ncbi:MAG: TetR family transcriptional regulator, partial [Myxococcales bacterium]|nr:TetR family transcriptional regulator [Myxococcales bacterium]
MRLAAGGGAQAVSMVAVARAVGAPSGSLYHRFSGRPELLARVWLAALASFEEAWWKVAASAPDPGVVAAAPVRWARKEPDLARVLAAHRRVDFVG